MDNDVLRQAPLFSALDDEGAKPRASMAETNAPRRRAVPRGRLRRQAYIVLEGKVKLGRTSSDGRENLLSPSSARQMFGGSLFDPVRARPR